MNILKTLLVVFVCVFYHGVSAQTQIKVMSYNILNFPLGEIPGREDTLRKIIDYYQPDLFLVQELKSEDGLASILNDVFNSSANSNFSSGTWASQVSNPGTSWPLQQNIIYNEDVFRLAAQRVITTQYRDINEFVLYLFDSELDNGADTTFFHVFVTHLKSSQGTTNEEIRRKMADTLRTKINDVPANRFVIAGGDFNLYGSSEPAYQNLIDPMNTRVMLDPINAPGEWHESNFPLKEILTQSTRLNTIFNDGAGGGMDDRFDFVLLSDNLMDPFSLTHYKEGTYEALGNNGTCYNQSIVYCDDNNDVPIDILLALYFMSDHLPVVFEIESSIILSNSKFGSTSPTISIINSEFISNELMINIQVNIPSNANLSIFNLLGQKLEERSTNYSSDITLPVSHLSPGMYIIVFSNDESYNALQFIKQ